MASGSHCPIGFHLVIGCRDGAAAPVGADDLWYHTGQLWVYVSTFLRFYVFPSPPGALQTPHMALRIPQMVLRTPQMALQTPKMALQTPQMAP